MQILAFLLDFSVNNIHTVSFDSCCTTCCIFSTHIAWQLSQVYGHTNFLLEYMNFLKIIHKEECFVI